MPLRADTFYFCVHSYIKKHKLREWLTVDEARDLLKNRKIGIDAANNCISRPGDETPLDVEAHMKQLGRLVFLYLGLGAIPVVIVDPVYAHPGSLKSYGNNAPALWHPARSRLRSLTELSHRTTHRLGIGPVLSEKPGAYDVIHRMTTDNATGVRRGAGPRRQEVATSA